jgi:UDP-N-acetyl-D-glucosamine dehydrogenase
MYSIMKIKDSLLSKITNRELKLGIVGLGYVGLPLAVAFAQEGFTVTGIDTSAWKVTEINNGHSYVEDVHDAVIRPLVQSGKLHTSTDYADLVNANAIIICVPTPLRKTKDPDISYIIDACERILRIGSTDKLIVLESTTYPGTTEEVMLPRLISNGDKVGENIFLAFSPERIDPGRKDYGVYNTPKVIGGVTPNCLEVALAL